MRTCEVAVIGLGLMGSAALHSLLRRSVDVLGFDPLTVGEARGSSHGSCRIYRRFNFENDSYTELSDAAFAGWRALEAERGLVGATLSDDAFAAAGEAAVKGAQGRGHNDFKIMLAARTVARALTEAAQQRKA